MACFITNKKFTLLWPSKRVPHLRKNQKIGVFGNLILFKKLKYTIYLFNMACSITHKKFMLVRPSKRGFTCFQKSENCK